MRKLKPTKRYRRVYRRVCYNCDCWQWAEDERHYVCIREPEKVNGGLAIEPWFYTCDRWIHFKEPAEYDIGVSGDVWMNDDTYIGL